MSTLEARRRASRNYYWRHRAAFLAKTRRPQPTVVERFEDKYMPVTESGCWVWTGCSSDGYGAFRFQGKMVKAHRFSYELHKGRIPEGMTLDHLCRVRCCVNPSHLEPVPMTVNVLRGIGATAVNSKKITCIHGHPFNAENTGKQTGGGRLCKICSRRIKANYKKRLRQNRNA